MTRTGTVRAAALAVLLTTSCAGHRDGACPDHTPVQNCPVDATFTLREPGGTDLDIKVSTTAYTRCHLGDRYPACAGRP